MKMKLFAALAATALFFTSCEKDHSEENSTPSGVGTNGAGGTGTGGTGTGGTGTGVGNNLANCKNCAYYPICSGSVYNYRDTTATSPTGANFSYTLTYIKDTIIDNVTYQKISGSGQQNSYFNCTNGVSTGIAINGSTQGGTVIPYVKTTALKANEPVGATWQDVISLSAIQSATYTYTMEAKGISRTVAGITYPDVIHLSQEAETTVTGGGTIQFAHSDYYLARGVGLIETIGYDDLNGGTQILHRILTSSIIP
jgi:hypothetical protein